MATQDTTAPAASFELADIYYTLFRHKWKIILCAITGVVLAAGFYRLRPPVYYSEAKLFIRYVVTENRAPGPGKDDSTYKSPDQRGETIIKSELEILTSLDLAQQVVKNIGAEVILAKAGGGNDPFKAATLIQRKLSVDVPASSSVIRIVYVHPDPAVVQVVLREVVDSYLKKHVEIHRSTSVVGDSLIQETDQLRSSLARTEEELRKVINKAGVISLEDSKKAFADQIIRLRQQIFDAQAELAERRSVLDTMTKGSVNPEAPVDNTPPSPEQVANYQKVTTRLSILRKREQDYLVNFTEESARVREVRTQIADAEAQKKKLETDFPGLIRIPAAIASAVSSTQAAGAYDPAVEAARIGALQAKANVLTTQLEEVRAEASKVDQLELSILELRRRKELEEANYLFYSKKLDESRINDALGVGRVSNISQIEAPTPPIRDWISTAKILFGIAAAGFGGGLAWAFLIELYLDRSIRRSSDIERTLRLPLFLSIPKMKAAGWIGRKQETVPQLEAGASKSGSGGALALSSQGSSTALNPYYETLRDRLISYFDTLNVRHKPKLVAVTGLGRDTGVTTIAAGLARSFSETGEGNVLLVDMTQGQGSAQHFHKGTTVVGLEEMLDTKNSAQVNENLYVVSENSNSERLARGMPQRFSQIIPKLKASDFDYIIFDMPPVSQISITPRLASFMDMMLLVVESEKTDREIAAQASAMLSKAHAPVGVVMNKTKSYIPLALQQDREFFLGT